MNENYLECFYEVILLLHFISNVSDCSFAKALHRTDLVLCPSGHFSDYVFRETLV